MAEGTRLAQLSESIGKLKEAQESQQQIVDELVQQLSVLASSYESLSRTQYRERELSQGNSINRKNYNSNHDTMGGILTRAIRLDFPKFNGTDPIGWLYRAHQFFNFHQTPLQQRLPIASFHMEGKALAWYQWMEGSGALTSWDAFAQALEIQYGPTMYDDPVESLTKLRQVTSVEDYQTQFEFLANRTDGLTEPFMISCFMSGLKDDIRLTVKMFKPTTLSVAFGLARIQEEKGGVARKTNLPIKRLMQLETKERRDRGLCYNCDDKWSPGHKCKFQKLYLLDGTDRVSDTEDSTEEDITVDDPAEETPEISLHAIAGAPTPQTMRLQGHVNNQIVVVLVDSGSTHNFLDPSIALKARLPVCSGGRLQVMVANCDSLASEGRCERHQYLTRSHGKELWLEGKSSKQISLIDDVQFKKTFKVDRRGVLLQLFSLSATQIPYEVDPQISNLLNEYGKVFAESKGLPPPRAQDHRIPLTDGAKLACVRPYQYPYYQKGEIERIVKEMLQFGIVRPSHSPFSSPVLLVTKLLGYNMVVEYKSGHENKVADALSRREEEVEGGLFAISSPIASWVDEIKSSYGTDPELQILMERFSKGELHPTSLDFREKPIVLDRNRRSPLLRLPLLLSPSGCRLSSLPEYKIQHVITQRDEETNKFTEPPKRSLHCSPLSLSLFSQITPNRDFEQEPRLSSSSTPKPERALLTRSSSSGNRLRSSHFL
ncbi:hypothetical protein HHK36_004402 [Tetracentron sinense]|uniref:Retrotransposon gag domain-containing protein n=1 Tax=Tetracentron sinense TaxID=13715 RepID=A0A835DQ84_TETSI|nr:hypothetical protein HHK36_004402 [Tetracentron sinense]